MMRFARALRREDGSTMIAVLMVLMIVTVIGVTSAQLARHTNDATSVDRERFQGVSAAEAGVSNSINRIQAGSGCDAVATPFATLFDGTKSLGRYRTQIKPEAGTSCGQTTRRVIDSWGYPPTGGNRALRHLEVTVELVPQAGFPYTLFAEGSDGTIYIKNNGTITGDVYSETLDQTKNNVTADNIITPGSVVTQNNAVYSGTIWAGGNITLGQNSNVGKSLLAAGSAGGSQGTINVGSNAVVGGDARAKNSITLGGGAVVHGSVSQNDANVTPPPVLTKPAFTWNAANYSPAPVQGTAAAITTAITTAKDHLHGTYRSTDAGIITIPDTVTVDGPLTIVSSGKIAMGRTVSVSGGPYQAVFVALSTASDSIDIPKSLTIASGLSTLLYSLGGVDQKNNISMTGSVYANTIDAKNTYTVTKAPSLMTNPPPGFTWDFSSSSKYAAIPTLWREIVPGVPPA
jgi:hypothetical protein